MKNYFFISIFLIITVFLFGFFLPFMISSETELVLIGIGVIIFIYVPCSFYFIRYIINEVKKFIKKGEISNEEN